VLRHGRGSQRCNYRQRHQQRLLTPPGQICHFSGQHGDLLTHTWIHVVVRNRRLLIITSSLFPRRTPRLARHWLRRVPREKKASRPGDHLQRGSPKLFCRTRPNLDPFSPTRPRYWHSPPALCPSLVRNCCADAGEAKLTRASPPSLRVVFSQRILDSSPVYWSAFAIYYAHLAPEGPDGNEPRNILTATLSGSIPPPR
jgi:hypothetical protein